MSWVYRPPSKFDSSIASIMEKTLKSSDKELSYYFDTKAKATTLMRQLTYFRWCVRQDRERAGNYFDLEMQWDFRAKLHVIRGIGYSVTVRAIPARLGALFDLNDWLGDLDCPSDIS